MLTTKRATWRAVRRCAATALCAVGGVGVTAALVIPSATATAAASGAKIITAWPADVTSLDPANLSTNQDHALSRNIYQTLELPSLSKAPDGSLKVDGANVKPYLATSWTVSKNTIIFHLRSGVHFYPSGNVLTAADVKFSLDRIFQTPGAGDLQSNNLQGASDITVIDAHTIKLTFTSPTGTPMPVTQTQLFLFSQHFTGVVDSKVAMSHASASDPYAANWLRQNAAGSGPYYIASRNPGVSIVLAPVPNSWLPAPAYSEVDITITTGSIASLLQSGSINFADGGMTNQQINTLANAGKTVVWQDTGNFDMFAITSSPASQVGPLGNRLVREAIAYVVPYSEVLKNILYGRGERAGSIVMNFAPEYKGAWLQYSTNIAKAKALMKQAGNPAVSEPLYYLEGDEDQTNTAILLKASLAKIGITATLTPETQAGLFDVVDARSTPAKGAKIGPPGLELFNWSGFTDDPSIVIGYWATKGGINNYALYSSPAVNAINTKWASQPGSAARTAAYQKAQTIIANDVPYIPIAYTGSVTVVAKGITGVSFSPGGSSRFWTLHPTGTSDAIDNKLF